MNNVTQSLMESTIELFNGLPIEIKETKKISKSLLRETIKRGFVFSPEIIFNYSEDELLNLTKDIGLSSREMNSSFHKSWKKVKEADIEQLVLEQMVHYITTYGFQRLGIYDEKLIYIPDEKLKVPAIKNISLTIIKGYSKEEFKEKIIKILNSGIALGIDTIDDIVTIALWVGLTTHEIEKIKNKETRVIMFTTLDRIPEDPVEFLRLLIYRSTEKTLLIKSKEVLEGIKGTSHIMIISLVDRYKDTYGLERLAEIFYRFKPLFLAFKTNPHLSKTINKIRKLAYRYHKPMRRDFLNDVTFMIKKSDLDLDRLERELHKVNVFRKIRLAYALQFRSKKNCDSIMYRIRNGKGWSTDFSFQEQDKAGEALERVMHSIVNGKIRENVEGKRIYIPEYIKYSLPATEKQFTGNFPSGTCVNVSKDMVFGIHWDNLDGYQIDLDLSLMSVNKKFGWDANYRSIDRSILFSGDITDAVPPDGASELFYIGRNHPGVYILNVNYYNFNDQVEVPFQIMVAEEKLGKLQRNYMINPNHIVASASDTINQRQKLLGLVLVSENICKFYFTSVYIGGSITSSTSPVYVNHTRKYLFDFYVKGISLDEVLLKAGASIVRKENGCDINLSPELLEKDTIINLLL